MGFLDSAREALENVLSGGEAKDAVEQSTKEIQLVAFVKNKLDEVRMNNSRVAHEGVWLTNIAYLLGFDGIYFDTTARQFRPLYSSNTFLRKNRVYQNKILPTVNNRLARLTKSYPKYDVRPASMDQEDKDAAQLGLNVIMDVWNREKINAKRLNMVQSVQQCGHSYFKLKFDESKGPQAQMLDDVTGEMKVVRLGDVTVEMVSAFEVFPDPLAMSRDELQWLIHAKVRPLNYFKEQYPEKGSMVKEEDIWLSSLLYEARIAGMNNSTGAAAAQKDIKNCAIEMSYYEKPNPKYPKGRHIICANGVLLKNDELPIDEIPFAKFDDILIAGKYYSEPVISQMRPIQDQLNRNLDLRARWTNRLLAGKYLAARGHGLIEEAFDDESGEIIEYDPVPGASEPHAIQVPMIPQYSYNEDEVLERKMNDISGINEISRGQLPSSDIPAIGMQFLVEQDDTRIGVITEQHEHSYADLGRMILKFAAKYYVAERTLKVAGKSKEYLVKKFTGKDIRNNFDVFVVRGSTLPGSKVLDRQSILNAYQLGILGDPADPAVREKLAGSLEFGDTAEIWKDYSIDMAQIKRHLEMIEKDAIEPPVHEGDNHTLFYQEFNRFRKSEKFDRMTPDRQAILLKVMELHLNEQVNLSAPGSGADPENPDLQESSAAKDAAAQVMGDSMEPEALAMEQEQGSEPEFNLNFEEQGI